MDELELREAMCVIGRRMNDRGLIAAWDGNISARLADDRFLCTPTMTSKGLLTPPDLCVVDRAGRLLSGSKPRTSEILLHLAIYRERHDVQAVVHAHPPHACAFAITGSPVPNGVLAEVEVFLGVVPTVPYTIPGTAEFAESVVPYLSGANTLVLANHGTVSFGPSLDLAYGQTEILDAFCRMVILARSLGPLQQFSTGQIAELLELKRRLGFDDPRLT